MEAEKQFAEETEGTEDTAIRAVMVEKLTAAIHTLTDEETAIIHALFYQEIARPVQYNIFLYLPFGALLSVLNYLKQKRRRPALAAS